MSDSTPFYAVLQRAILERWSFARVIELLDALPEEQQTWARVAVLEVIRDEIARRRRLAQRDPAPGQETS